MSAVDMSAAAITRRLREVGQRSDLGPEARAVAKVDMSQASITRRLRKVSELRALCLWLGREGRSLRDD